MVCVEERSQKLIAVVIVDAGLARKHLQNGGSIELVVRIVRGKNFENDDVGGDTANQADKSECGHDFEHF